MKRTIMVINIFFLCLFGGLFVNKHFKQPIIIANCRYPAVECEVRRDEFKIIKKLLKKKNMVSSPITSGTPEYLMIIEGKRILIWRSKGAAYAVQEKQWIRLPGDICRELDLPITRLETEIAQNYGELIPWIEAQKYFPRFQIAEITDCLTGYGFKVQRRAGSYHADCQPITRKDTAIMKKAFGGRWSWDRRAIIVSTSGHRIAASMAGQPHGAGAIPNNGFDGHFCIHFWKSRVHASGKIDARHQWQVLKAAGSI